MPQAPGATVALHVSDDTFVAAAPELVAAAVADPARWGRWWPDLDLETTRDRGIKGRQWAVVRPAPGTAELWLEPWRDGTIVHLYLRLERPAGRRAEAERQRRERDWKRQVTALKDELEGDRRPGTPAVPPPA